MATSKKTATKKKVVAKKAPAVKKTVVKAAAKKTATPKPATKKAPPPKAVEAKPTPIAKAAPAKPASKPVIVAKKPAAPAAKAVKKSGARGQGTGTVVESIEPYRETPGEDYMNDAQREHFRNILLAWKRELMEEVDRTVHHMQDEAANFPDPNDRATQESEFSMELRTRDRERKLIKKIDETLGKLDHDEYGYCESCGVEIGIRRLEARPTAALCIDCKTLDEIREKQMGG